MLEVIDNHSVYLPALSGGPVLDVGCRGFRFAQWFADRGHRVIALDPAGDIEPSSNPKIEFLRLGLASESGTFYLTDYQDKEANRLVSEPGKNPIEGEVEALDIATLMKETSVKQFDVVKLNCEGAEFDILDMLPGPVSRQLVISFHEHVGEARRGRGEIDALIGRLGKWYTPIQHRWERKFCCSENYWDSILVER